MDGVVRWTAVRSRESSQRTPRAASRAAESNLARPARLSVSLNTTRAPALGYMLKRRPEQNGIFGLFSLGAPRSGVLLRAPGVAARGPLRAARPPAGSGCSSSWTFRAARPAAEVLPAQICLSTKHICYFCWRTTESGRDMQQQRLCWESPCRVLRGTVPSLMAFLHV